MVNNFLYLVNNNLNFQDGLKIRFYIDKSSLGMSYSFERQEMIYLHLILFPLFEG